MRWIALLIVLTGCAAEKPKLVLSVELHPQTQESVLRASYTLEVP